MDANSRNHMDTRQGAIHRSREPAAVSTDSAGRATREEGYALPIMVFALVLLGMMGAAGLQSSGDELLSAVAVSNSSQAFYAAEAGLHDAVSVWNRGAMDTLLANPGDSVVGSWTAIENRCSYQVVYRRVDAGDTDTWLYSLESTGQSPGINGGRRRVGIMMRKRIVIDAAVAFESDLLISGDPEITGLCGQVHTNGSLDISGSPVIAGTVTAVGSTNGTAVDTLGNSNPPTAGAPTVVIPDLDPFDYCGDADFVFTSAGMGTKVSTSESFDFSGGGKNWGWKWDDSNNIYQTDDDNPEAGTYCIDGNVEVGTDPGTPGNPLPLTLLTSGSIKMDGNPYLVAAHPDSILIAAKGDLKLNGNPVGGNKNFEGLIYGWAQCEMNGNPVLYGQLLCKDNPDPAGSMPLISENKINGNMELTYMCGGFFAPSDPAPIAGRMWNHVW